MRKKYLSKPHAPSLLIGSLFLLPATTLAAGFKLMEQSVSQLGRAYAGESLAADDASAAFYNPADMMLLKGNYLQIGTTGIDVNSNFYDESSSNSLAPVYAPEGSHEDAGATVFVPLLHFIADLKEDTRLGFSVTAPFGLRADYDDNWIGRYHVTKISVETADFNASVGYKLTPTINIGLGASYQYFETIVEKKIFTGGPDLTSEVTIDDWSWGYNLGLTGDFGNSRFSLAYRSHVEHDLEGDVKITNIPKGKATSNLDLPATTTLNAWHRLTDRWEIMASARYTEWESVYEVIIYTDYGTEITPTKWENSWTGSIGVNYQRSPTVILRAGISYDATPIPHEELRTPRLPDGDRQWLSVGATFGFGKSTQIDVAYAHLFTNDISTNVTVPIADGEGADTLNGNFDELEADLLGIQITYKF